MKKKKKKYAIHKRNLALLRINRITRRLTNRSYDNNNNHNNHNNDDDRNNNNNNSFI